MWNLCYIRDRSFILHSIAPYTAGSKGSLKGNNQFFNFFFPLPLNSE